MYLFSALFNQKEIQAKRDHTKYTQWTMVNRNQKHNVKINLAALGGQKVQPGEAQLEELDKVTTHDDRHLLVVMGGGG